MSHYTLISLGANDCREVILMGGFDDGKLLGYVIRQPWFAVDKPWVAYTVSFDDIVFHGRFATADEAARAVAGE